MLKIALKMLINDRAKYLGLVFGIMFATFLMTQQVSIFVGILVRTSSQIEDIPEADLWIMDPKVLYLEVTKPMPDKDLHKVRGVEGVQWAVPLSKGFVVIRAGGEGQLQQGIMMGLDNRTLVGLPKKMIKGEWRDINQPDAIIMDEIGYKLLWPNQPIELGKILELNDKRAILVGVSDSKPPFFTFPIIYTKYNNALAYSPGERNRMSFILAKSQVGTKATDVAKNITERTGLKAVTSKQFEWMTVDYFMKNTGIPINFGLTILLGFIIGGVIVGQTLYMFIIENLRQFGTLKAVGVTNRQILGMVIAQTTLVTFIGYSIGTGLVALFFQAAQNVPAMKGFGMLWEVCAIVFVAIVATMVVASFASIRRVMVLDPAIVFRS